MSMLQPNRNVAGATGATVSLLIKVGGVGGASGLLTTNMRSTHDIELPGIPLGASFPIEARFAMDLDDKWLLDLLSRAYSAACLSMSYRTTAEALRVLQELVLIMGDRVRVRDGSRGSRNILLTAWESDRSEEHRMIVLGRASAPTLRLCR